MKISFVETGSEEQVFFGGELSGHEIEFCDSLDECSPDIEVLSGFIYSKIGPTFIEEHPALRLIATRSTTWDHIDLNACARHGVTVCSVGSYGDHTVPEHIFALMLALCRKLRLAMDIASTKSFSYEALRSVELNGKTLGVVGTGRIGRQVLRIAKAFGMTTLGYDCCRDPEAERSLGFKYVSFCRMLRLADFVSVNVPLTDSTFHLFNRETFQRCRRGMILINTARGPIVDPEALIEALDSGIIAGAGLDVLEDERLMRKKAAHLLTDQIIQHLQDSFPAMEPLAASSSRISEVRRIMHQNTLIGHPNVIVTPHVAFNSHEAIERIDRTTVENINAFLAGVPQNLVGPKVQMPLPSRRKICI